MSKATMSYEHYKNLWEQTKPIRGRSVDVRPIGERRRDWEQITRKPLVGGEYSYAARLYSTDVVEYLPNGNIILRTGGWETPSTAEFIHEHSPFTALKQNRKVWVRVGGMMYPVGAELELRYDEDTGGYAPVNNVLIQKKVVDRAKAKDARAPVMPFLDWAKTFLAMSDGWVMHETRKAVVSFVGVDTTRGFNYDKELIGPSRFVYERICNATPDEYLKILCTLLREPSGAINLRIAETIEWGGAVQHQPRIFKTHYYDMKFDFTTLKLMVYGIVSAAVNIMTTKEVQPTGKAMTNVL